MAHKLANNKDARKIISALRKQGWRIERRSSHVLAFDPSGTFRPLILGKASDHRTRQNTFSEIKRRDPEFDLSSLT